MHKKHISQTEKGKLAEPFRVDAGCRGVHRVVRKAHRPVKAHVHLEAVLDARQGAERRTEPRRIVPRATRPHTRLGAQQEVGKNVRQVRVGYRRTVRWRDLEAAL